MNFSKLILIPFVWKTNVSSKRVSGEHLRWRAFQQNLTALAVSYCCRLFVSDVCGDLDWASAISFNLLQKSSALIRIRSTLILICDALRDLVPFSQFEKREKYPWRSITFSKIGLKSALNVEKYN